MNIAVMSDTHGNHDNLDTVLDYLSSNGIDTILHCGDVGTTDIVTRFADYDVFVALGNTDNYQDLADQVRSLPCSLKDEGARSRLSPFFELEFEGTKIAFCHGHTSTLDRFMDSGEYDFVFHGHTHRRRYVVAPSCESTGIQTRIINPGSLGGGGDESKSFCLIDTRSSRVEFFELPPGIHGGPRQINVRTTS